jgi:hypothetical protein
MCIFLLIKENLKILEISPPAVYPVLLLFWLALIDNKPTLDRCLSLSKTANLFLQGKERIPHKVEPVPLAPKALLLARLLLLIVLIR